MLIEMDQNSHVFWFLTVCISVSDFDYSKNGVFLGYFEKLLNTAAC